jgi:hypothetical protein
VKLGNQIDALKAWIDNHPFLYREGKREKYHEDPLSFAKEEVKQREKIRRLHQNIVR